MPSVSVPECRLWIDCVQCKDDTDCGTGDVCADVSFTPSIVNLACAPACVTDDDCQAAGAAALCTETAAPLFTQPTGTVKACVPLSCPTAGTGG
jgi:hypothetical protein